MGRKKIVESRRTENSIVRQEDKVAHLIDLITALAAQKEMETICGTSFSGSETASFLQGEKTHPKTPSFQWQVFVLWHNLSKMNLEGKGI